MKVYLMYPDRDFDPKQKLSPNHAALTQDLELNTLFEAMVREDEFLFGIAKQALFSSLTDPKTIRYRQEILKDCLKNPEVIRQIYIRSNPSKTDNDIGWAFSVGTSMGYSVAGLNC